MKTLWAKKVAAPWRSCLARAAGRFEPIVVSLNKSTVLDGRPVHEPHRHIPLLRVPPDQIGFAIAVARHRARHFHPPDLVRVRLSEPEVAVRARA